MGGRPRRDTAAAHHRGPILSLLLLDTTFLIDAERGVSAVDNLIADDDDTAVAAITVAELLAGVALASGRRQAARRAFAAEVVTTIPVIAYDLRVAEAHSRLLVAARQSGRPRGAHDLIIAATAVTSGRIVVTADPAGFQDLPGVDLVEHR